LQDAVEAFDVAVGLGPVGPGAFVADARFGQNRGERTGAVAGTVAVSTRWLVTPQAANAAMALRMDAEAVSLVSSGRISEYTNREWSSTAWCRNV